MRQHQPFGELPPRWILIPGEQATLCQALRILQLARERLDDPETLGRAEAALEDVLAIYSVDRDGKRPASQGAA